MRTIDVCIWAAICDILDIKIDGKAPFEICL